MDRFLAGEHVRAADFLAPQAVRGGGHVFRLYAPHARRVTLVLDKPQQPSKILYDLHEGRRGLWCGLVDRAELGDRYAYLLEDGSGQARLKADPFAVATAAPASPWSVLTPAPRGRPEIDVGRPRLIYEVHLPSLVPSNRAPQADVLAADLVTRARRLGATHIEFLPLTEYPHADSWGYQVTHYFAPTARIGGPAVLAELIDLLHEAGLGVLLDWVGGHFAIDSFALASFDGAPVYEVRDSRARRHPDWGTFEFALDEGAVQSFLLSSALFWLERYGFDGLRVDAVSSILYRDYSRAPGTWRANAWGGRESIEGIGFLRRLTRAVARRRPRAVLVAEESSNWPGVTDPVEQGGLGFHMCWDCGWMHSARRFFASREEGRRRNAGSWAERIAREKPGLSVLPLSHDEVVHGKRTPLGFMPGDDERRWANLRLFFTDLLTHPGCPLVFMGQEDAPLEEWNHRLPPPPPAGDPRHAGFARLLERLALLRREGWLDGRDDGASIAWIDQTPYDPLVLAFVRPVHAGRLLVLHNGSVRMIRHLMLAVPHGSWHPLLNTDDVAFGGKGRARSTLDGDRDPSDVLRVAVPPHSSLLFGCPS
jgi:1,4-alpha-glucan branching enzyme